MSVILDSRWICFVRTRERQVRSHATSGRSRAAWSVMRRLEDAVMAVMQRGDPEVLTPDLKNGRGNTKSFVSAVIKGFYT